MSISEKSFKKAKNQSAFLFIILFCLLFFVSIFMVIYGDKIYSLKTVFKVLLNDEVKGATFAITRIRIPRMIVGIFSGFSFGIAGAVFQGILKNPLASPDVIGVSSGTSAAAVVSILILNLSGIQVYIIGIIFGILIACFILYLSTINGFSGNRLVLIGIGIQAFMSALISFFIQKSNEYQVVNALRWLSGSLNGVQMSSALILVCVYFVCTFFIVALTGYLNNLSLNDEIAISLGINVNFLRYILIMISVILIAVTTSITGPIASVSFLSAPIIKRILKNSNTNLINSGLMGALIVCFSDVLGQNLFMVRYPVGLITGFIGAPYLLYLLLKTGNGRKV